MGLKKPDSKTRKSAQTGSSNLISKSKSSAKSGPKRKNRSALTAKPEIKTKRASTTAPKKKKRTYTAEELGVPTLNGIVPVGVQKPKGKKLGKTFVDDAKSMLAIMAVVNAEKEGERESKIMKSVRAEASTFMKREYADSNCTETTGRDSRSEEGRGGEETRFQERKAGKFLQISHFYRHLYIPCAAIIIYNAKFHVIQEETKDQIRRERRRKSSKAKNNGEKPDQTSRPVKQKKRVSFG
jgi:60S ribosomal subunit assembly/export protein LOC1